MHRCVWRSAAIESRVAEAAKAATARQVKALVDANAAGVVSGLVGVINSLDPKSLEALKKALKLK
jgi:hypothetical protein